MEVQIHDPRVFSPYKNKQQLKKSKVPAKKITKVKKETESPETHRTMQKVSNNEELESNVSRESQPKIKEVIQTVIDPITRMREIPKKKKRPPEKALNKQPSCASVSEEKVCSDKVRKLQVVVLANQAPAQNILVQIMDNQRNSLSLGFTDNQGKAVLPVPMTATLAKVHSSFVSIEPDTQLITVDIANNKIDSGNNQTKSTESQADDRPEFKDKRRKRNISFFGWLRHRKKG